MSDCVVLDHKIELGKLRQLEIGDSLVRYENILALSGGG